MKEFIKKIFGDAGFESQDSEEGFFFQKTGQEYYLVNFINEKQFLNFFKTEVLTGIIKLFDSKKKESEDIEKNTSAIIFVKLETLESIYKLTNQTFKIEEDEYFFKKYVIFYTDEIFQQLDTNCSHQDLSDMINNHTKFSNFRDDNLFDDKYFFIIQLFIKLPFLIFHTNSVDIELLGRIIEKALTDGQKDFLQRFQLLHQKLFLQKSKKESKEEAISNYYSRLQDDILLEVDSSLLTDYFDKF